MPYLLATVVILAIGFLPQLWVRFTIRRYSKDLGELPGTGGELANHLVKRFELKDVVVEQAEEGQDHYDPTDKAVRLSPSNYDGKSLTAIAIAAHEVGHAIQFGREETISRLRGRFIPASIMLRKLGLGMMFAFPIVAIVLKAPPAIAAYVGISLLLQFFAALLYLIVLPEEWDASFNKALPILVEGEYLSEEQIIPVRKVLKAAALTYFAAALADILNISRWLLLLRR